MELQSLSHITSLMNLQAQNFKRPLSLTRKCQEQNMKQIIELYNTVFTDDSPTPLKTEGQSVPEMSLFDSDHMQLDWTISVKNLMKKPEITQIMILLGRDISQHHTIPVPDHQQDLE